MATDGIKRLAEMAASGELRAGDLQRLVKRKDLHTDVLPLASSLLQIGPSWSDERQRWPVDRSARLLPTTADGLEWFVPFGEGWEIPAGFEYAGGGLFEWALWIQVVDGAAECLATRTWSAAGLPITADSLRRLPLGRLVREGVLLTSRPFDEIPKRIDDRWPNVDEALAARASVAKAYGKRNPRDHGRISDDELRHVAEVYRANLAGGAPTKAVKDELHYSRATAGRLVMQARERGFLPKTEKRKARG